MALSDNEEREMKMKVQKVTVSEKREYGMRKDNTENRRIRWRQKQEDEVMRQVVPNTRLW